MNILLNLIENVKRNFEKSFKEYNLSDIINNNVISSFNNYLNIIKFIDSSSNNFSQSLYINLLKSLDDTFFNSDYRKKYCESINICPRTLVTFWGTIRFYRRRYYDKFKNKEYYFVDELLFLKKNSNFDPFVCAKVCEVSSYDSYAKAGRSVSEFIGAKLKFNDESNKYLISRASARNIVINFNIPKIDYEVKNNVDILYVMLDEKWVHSQFNDNKDFMVKACVIFESVKSVYKYKKKNNSKVRYKLLGKHVEASIDDDLSDKVIDYIFYSYNTDSLKEIVFMGDCASWITSFPKNFKFHKDLKITFAIDGFHYAQALQHITTKKYSELYSSSFKTIIKQNNKTAFINLCNSIINLEPNRNETIEEKKNYILNNWQFIQNYYHKVDMKCSMESNISHCFADIFTSRPRAYSYKGLKQLLKLRLLKVNNIDIQKVYFDVILGLFNKKHIINYNIFSNEVKSHSLDNNWISKLFST